MDNIIIFVTCANVDEAKKISKNLLDNKLVACVNMSENISSMYWWKEKIEESKEVLLTLKTKKKLADDVVKKVKELHSYEVPEIIWTTIEGGNTDYLKWIQDSTK
ncbi:divalent-cation tolerance protein CutA [Elusimicrobiota bacterium]